MVNGKKIFKVFHSCRYGHRILNGIILFQNISKNTYQRTWLFDLFWVRCLGGCFIWRNILTTNILTKDGQLTIWHSYNLFCRSIGRLTEVHYCLCFNLLWYIETCNVIFFLPRLIHHHVSNFLPRFKSSWKTVTTFT